jgi:hypothetical protein
MDIEAKLRRIVEEYRRKHREYPGRILLKGEAVKAMADCFVKRLENLGMRYNQKERTPDEVFLDGGAMSFKGIPLIAELEPERELIVE